MEWYQAVILASVIGIAAGCTKSSNRAFIVAEGPNGRWVSLPCELDRRVIAGVTHQGPLGTFTGDEQPWARWGAYRGLSGAPIFDESGKRLGVNCQLLWGSYEGLRVFGWTTDETMQQLFMQGRKRGSNVSEYLQIAEDEDYAGIRDGSSVAAYEIWGDVNFGRAGHVYTRNGEEVLLFGHSIHHLPGPCSYALFHAPTLTVIEERGEFGKLANRGEMIGSITYQGRLGAYGILGKAPVSTRVRIEAIRGGLTLEPSLECFVVHSSSTSSVLVPVLCAAIVQHFGLHGSEVVASEVAFEVRDIEGAWSVAVIGELLSARLQEVLNECIVNRERRECSVRIEVD